MKHRPVWLFDYSFRSDDGWHFRIDRLVYPEGDWRAIEESMRLTAYTPDKKWSYAVSVTGKQLRRSEGRVIMRTAWYAKKVIERIRAAEEARLARLNAHFGAGVE